ncbi:MAG: hypothetical protein AAFV53_08210 [Myxococcota bacterium]
MSVRVGLGWFWLLMGCGDAVRFHDGLGERQVFGDDDLEAYVPGAAIDMTISHRDEEAPMDGWWVESEDPDIFEIIEARTDVGHIYLDGIAGRPGQTRLVVYDDRDRSVAHTQIDVILPTAADVFSEERGGSHGLVERVFANRESVWMVEYWFDQRIYGTGVLSVRARGGQVRTLTPRGISGDSVLGGFDRFGLTPDGPGEVTVEILVGDTVIEEVPFVSVDEVASIHADRDSEATADAGDRLSIFVSARDEQGALIRGVPFSWVVAGDEAELSLSGREYRYFYDSAYSTTLTVFVGEESLSMDVHGAPGEASDDFAGCASVSGAYGWGALWLSGLLVVRRRRMFR